MKKLLNLLKDYLSNNMKILVLLFAILSASIFLLASFAFEIITIFVFGYLFYEKYTERKKEKAFQQEQEQQAYQDYIFSEFEQQYSFIAKILFDSLKNTTQYLTDIVPPRTVEDLYSYSQSGLIEFRLNKKSYGQINFDNFEIFKKRLSAAINKELDKVEQTHLTSLWYLDLRTLEMIDIYDQGDSLIIQLIIIDSMDSYNYVKNYRTPQPPKRKEINLDDIEL